MVVVLHGVVVTVTVVMLGVVLWLLSLWHVWCCSHYHYATWCYGCSHSHHAAFGVAVVVVVIVLYSVIVMVTIIILCSIVNMLHIILWSWWLLSCCGYGHIIIILITLPLLSHHCHYNQW
jgi:hypothetical protein